MTIKRSTSSEIGSLVAAVGSSDEVRRESAVARLTIIGTRAVDRIVAAYGTAERPTRIALLRALEAIADPRALTLARTAIHEGGDVALAAIGVHRALLDAPSGTVAADALDGLVEVALSAGVERRLRLAALDALRDMGGDVRERVRSVLRSDPDDAVRARASDEDGEATALEIVWDDALDGRLPDDPAALRQVIGARSAAAPLGVLQKLVDTVAARAQQARPDARGGWHAVQGALHQALALRGSTIALYDLRETVAAASVPLPASFVTALHAIGDESCLEAIAAAHAAAEGGADQQTHARWRQQLEAAFQAIVTRERITRKSPVLKRIEARWPALAAAAVSTTSRTRPRPTTRGRT